MLLQLNAGIHFLQQAFGGRDVLLPCSCWLTCNLRHKPFVQLHNPKVFEFPSPLPRSGSPAISD